MVGKQPNEDWLSRDQHASKTELLEFEQRGTPMSRIWHIGARLREVAFLGEGAMPMCHSAGGIATVRCICQPALIPEVLGSSPIVYEWIL